MDLVELDGYCNSCKHFDRIMKGKAMFGYCLIYKQVVDARKQFERFILPYTSIDLGRLVVSRKERFNLKEDCWKIRM